MAKGFTLLPPKLVQTGVGIFYCLKIENPCWSNMDFLFMIWSRKALPVRAI